MSTLRVLVAHASPHGSTSGIADAVARRLHRPGVEVESRSIDSVGGLGGYDAVVIGAAIRYDRWLPEARQFVVDHADELASRPVAYFFSCMTLSESSAAAKRKAQGYADGIAALSPRVVPIGIGQFAGALDHRQMSPLVTLVWRIASRVIGFEAGDHRDWDAIEDWADRLSLLPGGVPSAPG